MIYTFYSFKGGVGRSMAVANIAELLYRRGLKVLMVDFDLEAPGLEGFFNVRETALSPTDVLDRRGIIDMLLSYKELHSLPRPDPFVGSLETSPNLNPFPFPIEPLANFIVPLYEENADGGALFLIPSGRRGGDEFTRYAERIRSFDWDDFYLSWSGEKFFDWFRRETDTIADIVLLDSRTGITEMSGVCTFHLADVVVMFVAINQQNLNGTQIMAQSLQKPKLIQEGRKGRELWLLFVPSRVEHSEGDLLDAFAEEFQSKLGRFIAPQLKFENSAFIDLKIPYISYYAYMENVAVREPEKPRASDLIAAYTKLASALVELAPRSSALYRKYYAPLSKYNVPEIKDQIVERTEDFTGRQWVFRRLNKWLEVGAPRVFLITGEPGSGKSALANRLVQLSQGEVPSEDYTNLGLGALAFSHFCQPRYDYSLDPLRFVENLAKKFANSYPSFAQALIRSGDQEIQIKVEQAIGSTEKGAQVIGVSIQQLRIGNVHPRAAFDRLIRRPLETLYASGFSERIVILVDALEAALTYNTDENILNLLSYTADSESDLPSKVLFLLTSRADPRVLREIQGEHLDLISDAPTNVDEIREYAYHRLYRSTEPRKRQLADQIARASEGNFLYARYALDELSARLDREEEGVILPVPIGLEGVYREFLKRELGATMERWAERVRPFLGALTVARGEGLTRTQLASVAGRTLSETDDILRRLAQYLKGSQPEGPFYLYHQSFRDFLVNDADYQVYPAEANRSIAEFYLQTFKEAWAECDAYGLRYTPTHLIEAIRPLELPTQRATRRGLVKELTSLLVDLAYIEARLHLEEGNTGQLEQDYKAACAALPTGKDRDVLTAYGDALHRESLVLRTRPGAGIALPGAGIALAIQRIAKRVQSEVSDERR